MPSSAAAVPHYQVPVPDDITEDSSLTQHWQHARMWLSKIIFKWQRHAFKLFGPSEKISDKNSSLFKKKKGKNLRCSLLYKATLYTVRFFKVNEDTCVTFLKN